MRLVANVDFSLVIFSLFFSMICSDRVFLFEDDAFFGRPLFLRGEFVLFDGDWDGDRFRLELAWVLVV